VTGVGGCGKTRLAIATAEQLAPVFPDGVRFADLAAITDARRVADAVAHALGLADDPSVADPLIRLTGYLANRSVLCVLDNCEHLLDGCARLAEAVVTRPGPSRLLATSRAPLGMLGEQVYRLQPLDFETDAARLFADRAAEARAGFRVDHANRNAVTQICRRLDGIPLAIELAAARVAHLSAAQILDRLDERFRLLTGAHRRTQRHQALITTLDWSHDLLEPREQRVLRRLAVFPAAFSLEAADAVSELGDVTHALGSLVANSLVQIVDDTYQLRYRLLETVRLYAETKLIDAGEAKQSRARHRDWMLDWLESIPLEVRWLGDEDVLTLELANVRAALEWSDSEGDSDTFARIAAGVDWSRGDNWLEGIRWCQAAVVTADTLSADVQAQLYLRLMRLMTTRGSTDWGLRNDWGQRAIDACRGEPSPLHAMALASRALGAALLVALRLDETLVGPATKWAEAAVAMSKHHAAPWQVFCQVHAGMTYTMLNLTAPRGPDRAEAHYAAAVAAARPSPPYLGLHAIACCYLALHRAVAGHTDSALALARDAKVGGGLGLLVREDPLAMALAVATPSEKDAGAARRELRAYDACARRADWPLALESVVLFGGMIAALSEDWERASRLLAAGEPSIYRFTSTAMLYFTFRDRVRAALGPKRARQLRDEGRAMSRADALEAALT
jgi:predicted ATPase